jgi:hypothetical protein
MKNSLTATTEEDLERLIFESRLTLRRLAASTGDVFERVRKFIQLYQQLPAKPDGAALLYQEFSSPAARYRELADRLVVGRLSKSERNPEASDLAVEDAEMSRTHFRIDLSDGFYILRDLESRNGTYLNNEPTKVEEALLKAGDIITAGTSVFVFTGTPVTST